MAIDYEKVTKAVLAIRDARSELKREYEEKDQKLKDDMEKCENVLLKKLLDDKSSSQSNAHATYYKETVIKPSCTDWQAFYDFIKENDAFEALEKRVTKKFVMDYAEENKGELPPGINTHSEVVVRVRRNKEG